MRRAAAVPRRRPPDGGCGSGGVAAAGADVGSMRPMPLARERAAPEVRGDGTELLLDAEELVVLGDPVGAGRARRP